MTRIDEQVKRLLEDAMKQPGVAEVMQVYEAQRAAVGAHAQAQQALAPRWVFSTSTSSSKRE